MTNDFVSALSMHFSVVDNRKGVNNRYSPLFGKNIISALAFS